MWEASDLCRTLNLCRPGSTVAPHLELGSALQFRPRHHILTLTKRDHPLMVLFSLESAVWFGVASICTGDGTRGGRKGCEMGEWTGELNIYRHQTIFERQKPQSRPKLDPHWPTTDEATFNPCSHLHFTFCLGKLKVWCLLSHVSSGPVKPWISAPNVSPVSQISRLSADPIGHIGSAVMS